MIVNTVKCWHSEGFGTLEYVQCSQHVDPGDDLGLCEKHREELHEIDND